MTRSRSSRGRRRNRDRSNESAAQQEGRVQESTAPEPEAPSAEARPSAPPQERRNRRPERGPQARRDDQSREEGRPRGPRQGERRDDGRQGERQGGGRERSGRRRQGRARQQFQPVTGDVLKARVQVTGDRSPVHKRQITEVDTPEGPMLGCPMLTRTRLGLPFKGGNQAPRCALAWAIHSETEASYCMETHVVSACWKAHPERLEEIRQRLAERAAD